MSKRETNSPVTSDSQAYGYIDSLHAWANEKRRIAAEVKAAVPAKDTPKKRSRRTVASKKQAEPMLIENFVGTEALPKHERFPKGPAGYHFQYMATGSKAKFPNKWCHFELTSTGMTNHGPV